jgi:F-type H+-transporting ATPase subunit b
MSLTSRLFSQALRRTVSTRHFQGLGWTKPKVSFADETWRADESGKLSDALEKRVQQLEAWGAPPADGGGVFDKAGDTFKPDMVGKWPRMPTDFKEFPERDLVNFPHPYRTDYPSRMRLGVIPDTWFKFFYEKTGETGGYLFMGGTFIAIFSTETIVSVEGVYSFRTAIWDSVILTLLFGSSVSKYCYADPNTINTGYDVWQARQLHGFHVVVSEEEKLQQCYSVVNDLLFVAKRENVQLQLEAEYRHRVSTIHDTVKRRLDFLAEYEATRRRFEQDHMIEWVMKQVSSSLTPQMETATLKQCVSDLKALGNKA